MIIHRKVLAFFMLLLQLHDNVHCQRGVCPLECSCFLDSRGRRKVVCDKGNLVDPLPVLMMPDDMEILVVGASQDTKNRITLGPIFKGHRKLEEIHVFNSEVPALGPHSFWGLRQLQVLNVSYNTITALMDTNFRGCEVLKILDLSHNFIESVPSAVFRHVRMLSSLNLSYNRIPEIAPRIFFGLSKLEVLDMSYNPLGYLSSDRFKDTTNLIEFRCAGCGLLRFSGSLFDVILNLRILDIGYNRLTEIPQVLKSKKLTTLYIDGNHISTLSVGTLTGLPLKTLSLSRNRLSHIEGGAMHNLSLTYLDLSYNRLSHLDAGSFEQVLGQIKSFYLSGNSLDINQLIQLIPKARQLRHLALSDLGLTSIPPSLMRNGRHLKYLNVSSNFLSRFPQELLYSVPHLQTLDLSVNSFKGLEEDLVSAFKAMVSLTEVKLDGNPWQCDLCNMKFMLKWLQNSPKQPHSRHSCITSKSPLCLKCIGPESMAGKDIISLERHTIPPCRNDADVWLTTRNELKSSVAQSDDPRFSRGYAYNNDVTLLSKESIATFFKDHVALLVGAGCGLVLALLLVVVVALIVSRRHSAYYYTCEGNSERKEKLVGRNNNESPISKVTREVDILPPYEPMAISKVHAKMPILSHSRSPSVSFSSNVKPVSIATIEEVSSLNSITDCT